MARVPQASDIAVSSFNVGSAPQIDIGVAKEIGRAGAAIGDAVASLGGAFGEIAGKAGAAQSAQAEADYVLDWNQKDFDIWTGLSKSETPDGTSWQAAAPTYTDGFKSHRSDPKYASITPQRKLALDRQIAGSIQQRIIGEGGAARRYQTGQYNTLMGDLQTRTQTTIGELGPESPLVKDLPPTEGDSAYNRLYEERRNALHMKIDASVGLTLSPKQAEEAKSKIDAELFGTKLQWLQANDPDAYEKALEEAGQLEREEIEQPKAGDATQDTWRGPGSDGKPLGSLPRIYEDRVPTVADRRAVFKKGGVVVNLDTNWAKGDRQTAPMVVIPDGATKEQRAGAEAYAQAIAQVYKEKFGKTLKPFVKTRSENGRGRPFTMHTEPYSVNDSRAVAFFNSDEGRKIHAQILQGTLGKIPGVQFSIPHNPSKGDNGAAGNGGNEVQFAKALLGELKGGAQAVAEGEPTQAEAPKPEVVSQGRIPQDAVQQFAAEYGPRLQEAIAKDPQTPLAEVVSTEQMGAITELLPEGVDPAQITVEDAQDLLQRPEAQQVAQASGLNDQPAAPAPVERPLGPVKGGAEFSIKSKYGNVKFRSEEWNNMKPEMIKKMQKDFKAKRTVATQQNQRLAEEMMRGQEASLENDGVPLGEKLYNRKVIDSAYPMGTKKRQEHEMKVATSMVVAKTFEKAGDLSLDELMVDVEGLKPDENTASSIEEYNVLDAAYKKGLSKVDALRRLRREDPASAVENSSFVRSAREKFDRGIPKSQTEKRALIEARLTAQKQIGIAEPLRSPITKGEAAEIASGLEDLRDEDIQPKLEEMAKKIKADYGSSYTGVVLKSVIETHVERHSHKKEIVEIAQGMASRGEVSPLEIERARELHQLRQKQALSGIPPELKRLGTPVNNFDEKIKEVEGISLMDAAKFPFRKAIEYGRAANKMMGINVPAPSKEDIEKLKADPSFKKKFEEKYNLTPVQSFNIMQGK